MAKDDKKGHTGGDDQNTGYLKGTKWNKSQGQPPPMKGNPADKKTKKKKKKGPGPNRLNDIMGHKPTN